MTVYVDPLLRAEPVNRQARRHGLYWCHMVASSIEELHSAARTLGINQRAFQGGRMPHYDLTTAKRALALRHGALEVTAKILATQARVLGMPEAEKTKAPALAKKEAPREVGLAAAQQRAGQPKDAP